MINQAASLSSEIRSQILRVTFRNDDNGFTVIKALNEDDQKQFIATGVFPSIHPGGNYLLFGKWVTHATYGKQFTIERHVPLKPEGREAILRYLSSGIISGLGQKTAEKLVKYFGEETLNVLDQAPERLKEIGSLSSKKISTIVDHWNEHKNIDETIRFLYAHGITKKLISKIFETYGDDAFKVVTENPYRLATDIRGIGFLKADALAKKLGIPENALERVRAAIIYELELGEEKGHCYLTTEQIRKALLEHLKFEAQTVQLKFDKALNHLLDMRAIRKERFEEDLIYLADLFVHEKYVGKKLQHMLRFPVHIDDERIHRALLLFEQGENIPLSEDQRDAVIQSLKSRVFVLTGGPGVGKTTTSNAIIQIFKNLGKKVALCAPTGRAAQRLSEVSLLKDDAKTIHRLLEWNGEKKRFLRCEENPIMADVIIVDEASMMDIRLADALLRAISEKSQLIIIGDVDQLPSVGPGSFLRDVIESQNVATKKLTTIFRQAASSQIILAAHQINHGHIPKFDSEIDFWIRPANSPEKIKEIIFQLLVEDLPKRFKLDPVRDCQLITPMNKGDLGTQTLNGELQNLLNPKQTGQKTIKVFQQEFRLNDKVIQTANNYDLQVFNGDIGFINRLSTGQSALTTYFPAKERSEVGYTDEQVDDLRLAYAITIHKSQGSEFPVVIIPLSMQHYVMLERNLFYTAVTRAKKLAILVGDQRALFKAVQTMQARKRQTGLAKLIRN